MKLTKTVILAGIAATLLAGTAYAAVRAPALHSMSVMMPDGGIATIEYSGNKAPNIRFGTVPRAAAFFGPQLPFAALDRISAEMDRDMSQIMRQADMMAALPMNANPLFNATFGVAHANGSFCMRSTEIMPGRNGRDHVVTRTTGNCAAFGGQPGLVSAPAAAAPSAANPVMEASDRPGHTPQPMFRVASYAPR